MSETLGPYEILGRLGQGAMAVVWRGYDPRLRREVAIKEPVLPQGCDDSVAAEYLERFVREAQAAARLNHPGVVAVYSADIYDGRAAIVMELIDGVTLHSALQQQGPLPAEVALSVLDQLLEVVGYAHSKGVVHRDIKPDNVFITSEGRVKLGDFGIAHVDSTATLTQAGTVMGTPGYMAPEQIEGELVDDRTDIFAVGVIAYEMLLGDNPFGGGTDTRPLNVMYRIVNHEPSLEGLAELGPHVADAIAVALAKQPSQRFPSAEAFRAALRGDAEWHPVASPAVVAATGLDAARRHTATIIDPTGGEPGPDDAGSGSKLGRTVLGIAAGVMAIGFVALLWGANSGGAGGGQIAEGGKDASDLGTTKTVESTRPPPVETSAAPVSTQIELSLSVSDMTVTEGDSTTFRATAASSGGRVSGISLSLQRSYDKHTWGTVAKVTTSEGAGSASVRVSKTAYYRLVFTGSSEHAEATSRVLKVTSVEPKPRTVTKPKSSSGPELWAPSPQ